ncbi:MAG: DUF420 domain-containing protein [Sulfurimonas sp.]|nr:DUF420 domain-containing protein [Sulfurimonas sp.]
MEYMFQAGFLGTRAPFFMDFVSLIVAFLPFLMFGAIKLARAKKYKYHALAQVTLYVVSIIIFTYFEIGVRVGGGFNTFMDGSSVSGNYALYVLILHIIIAVVTLVLWTITITRNKKNYKHVMYGVFTFLGITATSFSGIWVYLLLFVF